MLAPIARLFERLSTGAWVILALALASTAFVVAWPKGSHRGAEFWVFNEVHASTYMPFVARWNAAHPNAPIDLKLLHMDAFERRMLPAFTANTPVAPLLGTERRVASRSFLGPANSVGFHDLTDRLRSEGLLEKINVPSLAPWTARGHHRRRGHRHVEDRNVGRFRARASTAHARFRRRRALRPFSPLGLAEQPDVRRGPAPPGGGRYFDDEDRLCIDSDLNARMLATLITWTSAPDRICTDVPDQVASGYPMRLDGVALRAIMPDRMVGQWKRNAPGLGGKLKLMPLPAFTRGGRRISVWGGTMPGIARNAPDFETAWAFAKDLYLSPKLAEELFRGTGIITPVKEHWKLPVFREPDPYFSGQPSGKLFVDQAPNVPIRSSSPFERLAVKRLFEAAQALQDCAKQEGKFTVDELFPEVKRRLAGAQAQVKAHMARNIFIPQ